MIFFSKISFQLIFFHFILGQSNSGRTIAIRNLAYVIGTYLWRFPIPSQNSPLASVSSFVQGMIQSGAWCHAHVEHRHLLRRHLECVSEVTCAVQEARKGGKAAVQVRILLA